MTDRRDTHSEIVRGEPEPTPNRLFDGLKVAPEIAEELALPAQRIDNVPLGIVPAGDIHLTLVPPWQEVSSPDATSKLDQAVKGLGCFPLRAALLWVPAATSSVALGGMPGQLQSR